MEESWKKILFFGTVLIFVEVTQTGSTYYIHQYILVADMKMSWTDAQSFCRTQHSDLATISDEQDISRINNLKWEQSFWIGLYDDLHSWRWSLVNEHFYTGAVRTYRRWRAGQPDNAGAAERCVSMMVDGFWRDNSCTLVKMALICFSDGGGDQYVLVKEQKSWIDAQSYCRQHHTDLVSVRSQAENQELQSRLQVNLVGQAWIGLHRDSWRWSDGSSSLLRFWSYSQPNNENSTQACANMQKGEWDDRNCDDKDNFLCQNITLVTVTPQTAPKAELRRTTVKVKLRTHSDLKLQDPSIRHTFLLQVEAVLNLQGFTDFKLSWKSLTAEPKPTETADACAQKQK